MERPTTVGWSSSTPRLTMDTLRPIRESRHPTPEPLRRIQELPLRTVGTLHRTLEPCRRTAVTLRPTWEHLHPTPGSHTRTAVTLHRTLEPCRRTAVTLRLTWERLHPTPGLYHRTTPMEVLRVIRILCPFTSLPPDKLNT